MWAVQDIELVIDMFSDHLWSWQCNRKHWWFERLWEHPLNSIVHIMHMLHRRLHVVYNEVPCGQVDKESGTNGQANSEATSVIQIVNNTTQSIVPSLSTFALI